MKENETKTQSKGIKVLKAILNTIINIMIVIVLITSILIAVMSLSSKASGVSTILGYTIQVVKTDSMKGGSEDFDGGDFETGDIIIGKAMNSDPDAEYAVGDIITYFGHLRGTDRSGLITHRIIGADKLNGEGTPTVYRTKGDNNFDADQEQGDTFYYIPAKDIRSLFYSKDFHGTVIKGFGNVLDFVQSQTGFFLVVLLPMIIFFMYELVRVILNATSYKRVKADEEKDEAVKAAVAEALAAKGADTQATPVNGMTAEELEQFRQFQEFQKMQKAQSEQAAEPKEEPKNEE